MDGRLDALAHRRIELWLAAHPEVGAAVEEHRQVLQACREAPIPEPTAAQWAAALDGVAARLAQTREALPPRRLPRWSTALAAAAAAMFLLALPGDLGLRLPAPVSLVREVTPIPVASAEDVEIVSIDAADLKALLVGHPPLRGSLELAAGGDVQIHYAEPADNSWVPAMEEVEGATPILIMPMRIGVGEKP